MEKVRTRGRPRAFDRGKALEIALKLFWEHGFEPTSVAELCQAMGINPPSLYAAFGNKAQLFLEAARYYEDRYWVEPGRHLMATADVYEAIHNFFQEAAGILLTPSLPRGCMVVLAAVNISAAESEIITELKKMRELTRQLFAERLRLAIEAGQIAPDTDVPALSGALNAFLEGLSLQAREGIFLSQLKGMAAYAVRLLPRRERPAEQPKAAKTWMPLF